MVASRSKEEQFERQLEQFEKESKAFEVSLSDLVRSDYYQTNCIDGTCSEEDLNNILWEHGLDINKGYEQQYATHRNWLNEIVTCARFVGKQRSDKKWVDFIRKNTTMYQN